MQSSKSSKIFPKNIVHDYIDNLTTFHDEMILESKDIFQNVLYLCANIHHDVTTFEVDKMVWNIENWTYHEWTMTFPWNERILKLCLKNHIFRSYQFLAELTFKVWWWWWWWFFFVECYRPTIPEILTITNFRHAASKILTCGEPEFKLGWLKLCNSDKL